MYFASSRQDRKWEVMANDREHSVVSIEESNETGFVRYRGGRRSSEIPYSSVLEKICDDKLRPRRHSSPQLWQPEDEDDVASSEHSPQQTYRQNCEFYEMVDEDDEEHFYGWEKPVMEVPNSVPCSYAGDFCSSVTSVGEGRYTKKAHASNCTEVEGLRAFLGLNAAITRNLEKRVAVLEAQLQEQVDERKSSMLNYALLMKKVTRLESRCNELESANSLRQSPHTDQLCDLECRFEKLEAQFKTVSNYVQPLGLECRLEEISMAAENAFEEIQRISTEFMGTASRLFEQLGFAETRHKQLTINGSGGAVDLSLASAPLLTAQPSWPSYSGDVPAEAVQVMDEENAFAENRFRRMLVGSADPIPNSRAPLSHNCSSIFLKGADALPNSRALKSSSAIPTQSGLRCGNHA